MGKGKGSFDHWASRIAVSKIIFELKGDVHEQVARDAFRLAGNKMPGQCSQSKTVCPHTLTSCFRPVRIRQEGRSPCCWNHEVRWNYNGRVEETAKKDPTGFDTHRFHSGNYANYSFCIYLSRCLGWICKENSIYSL